MPQFAYYGMARNYFSIVDKSKKENIKPSYVNIRLNL